MEKRTQKRVDDPLTNFIVGGTLTPQLIRTWNAETTGDVNRLGKNGQPLLTTLINANYSGVQYLLGLEW